MDKIIFFATLVFFPFGQLFRFGILNLFDITILVLATVTLLRRPKYPEWYRYFVYFLMWCLFSLAVNYKLFELKGILYLIRFWSYSMVAICIFNFIKNKKFLVNSLLAVSVASAVFGWLQYLIWPDLTSLKYLGWDDHLLRMVGTFLDPTYLGLILVLGIIISVEKFPKITYFLLISLAFTYSRSSYLIASLFLLFKQRYLAFFVFILVILLLPKNLGEGTNLARTVSGNNKLTNYIETLQIIKKSPAVGVGFNNLCLARENYIENNDINSHSCSGSDSSILFVLATSGVIGLVLFLGFLLKIPMNNILLYSFGVVVIHSLFANSLVYPHIMFWLFALVGLGIEGNRKGS